MALVPTTEAAMGPVGRPGSGRACHCRSVPRWHHGGGAGKHNRTQGQVQIVLKHTNELGSGGARAFSISAESDSAHVYDHHPIKTQLFAESFWVDLGDAVKERRPQI